MNFANALTGTTAITLQPPMDFLLSKFGSLEWPAALFDYQIEGIKTLLSRDALLLADDLGEEGLASDISHPSNGFGVAIRQKKFQVDKKKKHV